MKLGLMVCYWRHGLVCVELLGLRTQLTAETGWQKCLVTPDAWILTDEIEAQRLRDEELPKNFQLHVNPGRMPARESFVCEATNDSQ